MTFIKPTLSFRFKQNWKFLKRGILNPDMDGYVVWLHDESDIVLPCNWYYSWGQVTFLKLGYFLTPIGRTESTKARTMMDWVGRNYPYTQGQRMSISIIMNCEIKRKEKMYAIH